MKDKMVYRLIPCPEYDVSGMECWLEEMSQQGFILQKDGLFAGVATFRKENPQNYKYRLQPAEKSTSMWADNLGDPDAEEIELNEQFGWEYVAKRKEFYIYRTSDFAARELHTDQEVQALAMSAMRKRQRDNIFNSLFFVLVYPYIVLRGNFLMTMIHLGTITMGIVLLAIIWMSLNSIIRAIKLMKLRKQVLNGADLGSGKDWRKGALLYHVNNFFRRCVYVIAIILLFALFGDYISYEKYIPLEEYTGDMPFKTMQDFGPGGEMHLMNMKINNLNTVREWSDLLSPVNYEWDESGTVTYADGTKLSGGLEVIYHETKADWIAKRLAKEYLRKAKSEKDYEPLELEMENLDDVAAYNSILHFPSVILRKDNKIIHARFYRTGLDSVEYELVEWAGFLAESL